MYILAHASRSFMTVANSTTVEGAEHMKAALDRQQGRPLITVCNHVASLDDPLVMSTILPPELYSDASQLRWASHDCTPYQGVCCTIAWSRLPAGPLPSSSFCSKLRMLQRKRDAPNEDPVQQHVLRSTASSCTRWHCKQHGYCTWLRLAHEL